MLQPDGGVQEPDATFDDCCYPEGAYYHVTETADDQEWLGGSQAGGLAFSIVDAFVLAFLRQTCLTYVCTQIMLLPLTLVYSSLCIRALEAPGLYYDACMTYLCFRVVL